MANDWNDSNRRPGAGPRQEPNRNDRSVESRNWRSYERNEDQNSMGSGNRADYGTYPRGDERVGNFRDEQGRRYSTEPRANQNQRRPQPRNASFETSNDDPVGTSWRPSDRTEFTAYNRNSDRGLADDMGWDFGYGRETLPYTHTDYGRGDMRSGSGSFGFGSQAPSSTARSAQRDEHSYEPQTSWNAAQPDMARVDYTGRGPKGYRRSDDRIREDVSDALERHAHVDATEQEVQVAEGIVTLRGSVADRAQKRLSEDIAMHINGVKDVRNELTINQTLFERAKEFIQGALHPETKPSTPSKH